MNTKQAGILHDLIKHIEDLTGNSPKIRYFNDLNDVVTVRIELEIPKEA